MSAHSPYLDYYKRLKILRRAIDAYLRPPPTDPDVFRALKRLAKAIDPIIADRHFYHITQTLSKRAALFDKLRKTLRLNPKADGSKQNAAIKSEQQKAFELIDIRQSLEKFKEFRVEALVTQRSPHRPVREAFPHTVPRFQFFLPNWKPNRRIPRLAHNFAVRLALDIVVDYSGFWQWKGCSY